MSEGLAVRQKKAVRLTVGILVAVIASIIVAIVLKFATMQPDLKAELERSHTLYFETPRLVPDVALTKHTGEPFSVDQLKGQWDLINFGYTYCPDICPTNMADMKQARAQLEAQGLADQVRFWMVTVDPARDTVEQLSQYVPYYHPEFIGLTGSLDDITTLATQLSAVFYQEGSGEGYTVAHSDNYALIDPQGHFVALMRPPHKPSHIVDALSVLITQGS
ncbi:SCO family protein [Reinekea blandensis]|uniref:Sco1/SenC family protein n=1 Tax=Reinekea blandensis MED297 TaxID=314283 RepID=A4BD56_9GAMM|nr:SCO family protein [Reinekea blandensis]EAR09800.1 Sco1/SenC family protein [Reinekea sp. MED297] [Reinekea blandensis MED297]